MVEKAHFAMNLGQSTAHEKAVNNLFFFSFSHCLCANDMPSAYCQYVNKEIEGELIIFISFWFG